MEAPQGAGSQDWLKNVLEQRWLEQAGGALPRASAPAEPKSRLNLLVVNLEGPEPHPESTPEAQADLRRAFHTLVGSSVALFDGSIVKSTPQTYFIAFERAFDALQTGLTIKSETQKHNQKAGGSLLDVSIQVNTDLPESSRPFDDVLAGRLFLKPEKARAPAAAPVPAAPGRPAPIPFKTIAGLIAFLGLIAAVSVTAAFRFADGGGDSSAWYDSRPSAIIARCQLAVGNAPRSPTFAALAAPAASAGSAPRPKTARMPARNPPAAPSFGESDLRRGRWVGSRAGDLRAGFSGGKLKISGISAKRNFGSVGRDVQADLKRRPYLVLEVESCSGFWSLDLGVGEPKTWIAAKPDTDQAGKWVFDLRRLTGLSGKQELEVDVNLSSGGSGPLRGREVAVKRLEMAESPE